MLDFVDILVTTCYTQKMYNIKKSDIKKLHITINVDLSG